MKFTLATKGVTLSSLCVVEENIKNANSYNAACEATQTFAKMRT